MTWDEHWADNEMPDEEDIAEMCVENKKEIERLKARISELEAEQEKWMEAAWEASYRCIDMDGTQEQSFREWWASRKGE